MYIVASLGCWSLEMLFSQNHLSALWRKRDKWHVLRQAKNIQQVMSSVQRKLMKEKFCPKRERSFLIMKGYIAACNMIAASLSPYCWNVACAPMVADSVVLFVPYGSRVRGSVCLSNDFIAFPQVCLGIWVCIQDCSFLLIWLYYDLRLCSLFWDF